jgi:hypothetical protein
MDPSASENDAVDAPASSSTQTTYVHPESG